MNATIAFDCPRCGGALTMSERQGIEIDYCPQCRGVWLDRGELDKIIERVDLGRSPPQPQTVGTSAGGWAQPAPPLPDQPAAYDPAPYQPAPYQPWARGARDRDDDWERHRHHGKRRKSWLTELFD